MARALLRTVNQKAEELKARARRFLLEVIALVKKFPLTVDAGIIGRQLIRAAAGVAGNYRSACRARSHAEFTAKIGVVLDEADESELWLSVARDVPIVTSPDVSACVKKVWSSVQSSIALT